MDTADAAPAAFAPLAGTFRDARRLRGMKPLVLIGAVLIALGIAGLAIDHISFTERKTVIDVGPLKVTADEQRIIPIPTIAGIIAVVAGAGMIFFGRQARRS